MTEPTFTTEPGFTIESGFAIEPTVTTVASATVATTLLDAVPAQVRQVFKRALVCEYVSLTRAGRPVTWPVTPYVGAGGTLDITTGLAYPDKAERARRDPRVALLYSDPVGSGLDRPPVVLVEGRAAVRDADLQGNTDRFVRESFAKIPGSLAGLPWFVIRRLNWYLARIYVEVTPERISWWRDGDLSRAPEFRASAAAMAGAAGTTGPGTPPPPSDPPPSGPRLPSRSVPPADWRPYADRARLLGEPVVSMVVDGLPLAVPARSAEPSALGFDLRLPAGVDAVTGPVCLTFHRHGPEMEWQENVVLVGSAAGDGDRLTVEVERALSDWSLAGDRRERSRSFLRAGRQLRKRIRAEAERRGQPVPVIHRPKGL